MAKHHRLVAVLTAVVLVAALSGSAAGILIDTAGHWSAPLVAALEAKGIVSGDSLRRYDPDAPLTRAQMAKLLVLALSDDQDAQLLARYGSRYTDVPAWHWASGYIEALAESAVTRGYPDGRFAPADTVTRAQMATFLVRAAGLSEHAQLHRLEPTPFADDAEVPEWARGAVNTAATYGLMAGSGDGNFRPSDILTRAEGGVAVLRLMEFKGSAYQFSGTLIRFDANTRGGTIRDPLGRERSFTMAGDAQYFRSGIAVSAAVISRLDQVWVALGPQGTGRLMEARYLDLVGSNLMVQGQSVTVTQKDGTARTAIVQQGALVYLNGRSVTLQQVPTGSEVYLALDLMSNEVRVLDAVQTSIQGTISGLDASRSVIFLSTQGLQGVAVNVAKDALLFLDGRKVALEDLELGAKVKLAVDDHETVTYLQAER